MKVLYSLSLLLMFIVPMISTSGQSVEKHPRVIEVEQKLVKEASAFFERRLPGVAFTVTVDIDPLRRMTGYTYTEDEELPYFEVNGEEIKDEWDNPDLSVYQLIKRIKSAKVEVVLPDSVNKDEMDEIKNVLLLSIGLVPARDEVRFNQKKWHDTGRNSTSVFQKEHYVYGGMLVLFLLAFFFILKATLPAAGSKADVSKKVFASTKSELGTTSSPSASFSDGFRKMSQSISPTSMKADLKFRDPVKFKEIAQNKINELVKDSLFPNLRDMIDMYKIAKSDPGSLGALIYEFSVEHQQRIFSRGRGKTWYEVFSSHGNLDDTSLQLLDKMLRMRKPDANKSWSELLVQIWRLDSRASEFFPELEMKESMAILSKMPKSISIPIARKIYPGSWGSLIANDGTNHKIDDRRIEMILMRALSLMPYLDMDSLKEYSREIDLLEYLRAAPIDEERDIYVTLPKGSYMFEFRPPFYQIFEGSAETKKELITGFSLHEWALMLFNTPRKMRSKIEICFDDKSKYLLSHYMKEINDTGIDVVLQNELREKVAALSKKLQMSTLSLVDDTVLSAINPSEGSDEKAAA